MDLKYINPFVEAVHSVFDTMLHTQPTRQPVKISDGNGTGNGAELTTLVGITGQLHGVVVLRFPSRTALTLAGRMLGNTLDAVDSGVIDAVSEIVNMVAGSAKSKFDLDPPLQLGLPTVVEGKEYRVNYPSKSMWLEVPFQSDAGQFSMELTFESR